MHVQDTFPSRSKGIHIFLCFVPLNIYIQVNLHKHPSEVAYLFKTTNKNMSLVYTTADTFVYNLFFILVIQYAYVTFIIVLFA